VAVHEAGHAIVFACLGFELQRVQLSEPGSKLIGSTLSGEFVAAERTDLLASLLAGDMAVDAICDSRVSAEMKSARDQQLLRKLDRELGITEGEKRIARRKAGEVVEAQRKHIIRSQCFSSAVDMLASGRVSASGSLLRQNLGTGSTSGSPDRMCVRFACRPVFWR
jgi:hypothetical protein